MITTAKCIAIKPSIRLALLITFIHLGAGFCLLFATTPKFITSIFIIVVSISLYFSLSKVALLQSPKAVTEITLLNSQENVWQLLTNGREILYGSLCEDSYYSPYLICLRFGLLKKQEGFASCSSDPRIQARMIGQAVGRVRMMAKTSVVLSADAINANDWRQLQVILRGWKSITT